MMKNMICVTAAILSLAGACGDSYCEPMEAEELTDRYYNATDVQRKIFGQKYRAQPVVVSAKVKDVKEEDTFDVVNDVKRRYYKVTTEPQNTPAGNSFSAVIIYKDIDSVTNIDRGRWMTKEGKLLKVVDDRLFLSVWLYEGELSQKERELFK